MTAITLSNLFESLFASAIPSAEEIEVEISRTCEGEPLTFFEQMQTVAHEMVHVKQFIRKQYPSEREAKKLEFELYAKCFPWNLVT